MNKKEILNQQLLIKKSKCLNQIFGCFLLTILFLLIPLAPLTVNNLSKTNLIISIIVLFVIFGLPFGIILFFRKTINGLNIFIKIKKSNFMILEDKLIQKEDFYHFYGTHEEAERRKLCLRLYFEQFYDIYNKEIIETCNTLKKFNYFKENQDYYLIFLKNAKKPFVILKKEEYEIDSSLQNNIMQIEQIKNNIKLEPFDLKLEDHTQKEIIDIKKIKYLVKFTKRNLISAIVFILFSPCLLYMLCTIDLVVGIIVGIVIIFFLVAIILCMKYGIRDYINIKNKNFIIKKDIVKKINKDIEFNEKNETMSLSFEKYKGLYFGSKSHFYDIEVGDIVYLIFIPKVEEPIAVYNSKAVDFAQECIDLISSK